MDRQTKEMLRECDRHNQGIKDKSKKQNRESLGGDIERGTWEARRSRTVSRSFIFMGK